jgi:hypothetical protein
MSKIIILLSIIVERKVRGIAGLKTYIKCAFCSQHELARLARLKSETMLNPYLDPCPMPMLSHTGLGEETLPIII